MTAAARARGLAVPSLGATVSIWAIYALDPDAWPGLPGSVVMTGLVVANIALTALAPTLKIRLVRALQSRVVNPAVRALFGLGLNPLGVVLLRTRGRRSGLWRTTPVGAGASTVTCGWSPSTACAPAGCATSWPTRASRSGCAGA